MNCHERRAAERAYLIAAGLANQGRPARRRRTAWVAGLIALLGLAAAALAAFR